MSRLRLTASHPHALAGDHRGDTRRFGEYLLLTSGQTFMQPLKNTPNDIRTYRPFIDGLRAIAILTVVGSHLDLPGFGGGYVGVDIFFVISGYLIINQIISDIENRRFRLFDFWARRAFRILPAFLLVMVTCLVLATTVFVQPEHKEFAQSFFFSAIMAVNHHYLAHQGYFDMAAITKPLLHMWSLAVEEQFYLLAPITLLGVTVAATKVNTENVRNTWVAVTIALAMLSFVACVIFTYPAGRSNVSFYIMPTRGWEFILGGIAPSLVPVLRRWPAWIGAWLAMAGLAAIGLAVVFFNADTLYPSYHAALPALGAMLIIVGGLSDPRHSVARMLSTWPMVRIGLVSYAWYLWHWPLISFVRTTNFGGRDVVTELSVVALSFALAALTYRLIELPVRRWRGRNPFRPVAVVAMGTAAAIVIASVGYLWSLHVAPHLQPSLAGLEPVVLTKQDYPVPSTRGILLGDSHAAVIQRPFQEHAKRAGSSLTVTARAGCPPLLHVAVKDDRRASAFFCPPFFQNMRFHDADYVIIAARWNFYLGLPPSDPFYRSYLLVDQQAVSDPTNPYELLAKGLAATISAAKQAGVRRILIVGPLPEFPWYSPYCVMRAIRVGTDGCKIPRTTVDARRERTMAALRRAIAGTEGVRLIDPIDLFCTETACRPNEGRTLYFFDLSHLSPAGAERLYNTYENDFLWALTGDAPGHRARQIKF
jgi:peptidoglycan/LPS O-acetylase OafA/YrhL